MPPKEVKRVKRAKEPVLGQFKGDERYNKALDSATKGKQKTWVIRTPDLGFDIGRGLKQIKRSSTRASHPSPVCRDPNSIS
jgi:hypothetical protein